MFMSQFCKNVHRKGVLGFIGGVIYKNNFIKGARLLPCGCALRHNPITSSRFEIVKRCASQCSKKMATMEKDVKGVGEKLAKCHISKPPNILVYCKLENFLHIKSVINNVLNSDRYVVYHLTDDQVTNTPWSDHVELLLVQHMSLPKHAIDQFLHFHENGGKMLCFTGNLINSLLKLNFKNCKPAEIAVKYKGRDVGKLSCEYTGRDELGKASTSVLARDVAAERSLIFAAQGKGKAVCSLVELIPLKSDVDESHHDQPVISPVQSELLKDIFETELGLDCSKAAASLLTPCYLLGKSSEISAFLQRLRTQFPSETDYQLCLKSIKIFLSPPDGSPGPIPSPTPHLLPVLIGTDSFSSPYFNSNIYFNHLKTKTLGRVVLYTDVITTTMTAVQEMTDHPEIVAIAGRQTQGKGRSGNAWLSPEGCAMFSLPVVFALDSRLGRRPSFLQHLAALAIVEGILQIPDYQNLDIRLKWPNDIYVGESKCKIGGLIVTSTILQKRIHCVVGIGVNISNQYPTACVNDVISTYNKQHSSNLSPLSTDQFIARTLTCFESIIDTFQTEGHEAIVPRYLERWMHSGAEVTLSDGGRGVVQGLDEFGFLTVKMGSGGVRSVQPDGNSFDMLHNLISTKEDRTT